jgi:membrane-associated protease RseP (regulator of RpoE activity)
MFIRSVAIAFIGGAIGTTALAQNPLQDAIQGAVEGARQSAAQGVNDAVNDALGVPNQTLNPNQAYNQGYNQGLRLDPNRAVNPGQPLPNGRLRGNTTYNANAAEAARASGQLEYNVPGRLTPQMRQLGLQPGDTVIDQYGNIVTSPIQMQRALNGLGPNARVERNGQTARITVSSDGNNRVAASGQPRRLGIKMESSTNAVIISRVDDNSVAARAGLRSGDRIIAINGQNIRDPRGVSDRVSGAGSQLVFLVDRDGQQQEIVAYFDGSGSLPDPRDRSGNLSLEQRVNELEQHVGYLLNVVDQLQADHAQLIADHERLEGAKQ